MSVVFGFIQQLGDLIIDGGADADSLDTASMMSEITSEVDTIFHSKYFVFCGIFLSTR